MHPKAGWLASQLLDSQPGSAGWRARCQRARWLADGHVLEHRYRWSVGPAGEVGRDLDEERLELVQRWAELDGSTVRERRVLDKVRDLFG